MPKTAARQRITALYERLSGDDEGRRTFADYTEQQANQQELDELLQQSADAAIASVSSGDAPEQSEVIHPLTKDKGAQSHDEAR